MTKEIRNGESNFGFSDSLFVSRDPIRVNSRYSRAKHWCPFVSIRGLKLIGVREPVQNRIVPRWSEIFNDTTKYWIEQRISMHDIQVERHQLAIQVQLRLVV